MILLLEIQNVIVVLFYLIDFYGDFFCILPKFGRLATSMCVVWWYVYIYTSIYLYYIIYDYVIYINDYYNYSLCIFYII
jgi:hypothetical protein